MRSIVVMFFFTHTYFRSQNEGDISSVELILIQLVFVLSLIFRVPPIHFWFPPYNSKSTRFSASPVIKILELPHTGTMAYRENYIWHQLRKPKTIEQDISGASTYSFQEETPRGIGVFKLLIFFVKFRAIKKIKEKC